VRRKPQRGSYDRDLIWGILDEALTCHVAFVDGGRPYAIPTIHARVGDVIYLHGSRGSRMLRTVGNGAPCCITATLVDELVLTRAAMHHSLNYRSAMVLGSGSTVSDEDEKRRALAAVVDHIARGRSAEVRGPDPKELRGTEVVRVVIEEASAKAREGPGGDDEADLTLPYWAGRLPLQTRAGEPIPSPDLAGDVTVPEHVLGWGR
jgi:nitroimidazol reductase NimA-like FMN-containing flavoprotein (pyridoxamine 5'-phosphate oxidase superfamily)